MMFIFVFIIFCSVLVDSADKKDKVVSDDDESKIQKAGRSDGHPMPRRFLEDLSDYEFHVSHLRDQDFDSGRRNCKISFEDRVKKYKQMLARDASRIEFVSADPLPFDEKDLIVEEDKCEEIPVETKGLNGTANSSIVEEFNKTDKVIVEKLEVRDTATTHKDERKLHDPKLKRKTAEEQRRASQYQFSSVEYYDELAPSDWKDCPDDVEVVKLQQEPLKPYDIECELMLLWESLK